MKIFNKTKQTVISENAIEVKSVKDKTFGLLKYETPSTIVIKTRFGIHTFGMKYTIDVIIVDLNKKVVKIKSGLEPGRVMFWNPIYNSVIELPHGCIRISKTQILDMLKYGE